MIHEEGDKHVKESVRESLCFFEVAITFEANPDHDLMGRPSGWYPVSEACVNTCEIETYHA
jgi:hypothetical protein